MSDAIDAVGALGLPPERAIEHLGGKALAATGSWREWLDGQHARAFTVANVAKLDVLSDIRDSLDRALKNGTPFETWKRDLIPTLQAKGWWQRESTTQQLRDAGRIDEATGEIRKGLTPARLRTIYQTNMQSAYMAGRYDAMVEGAKERPYWQWVAVLDSRTRPSHRAMNGRVLRYDDQGWGSMWPPCGYNCRCRVRALSQRDVQRKRLTVESTAGKLSQVDVPLAGGGTARVTRYSDPSLGKNGYFQPDPGFSNNPARSVWAPRLARVPQDLSQPFVRDMVSGPAFERFVQAGGAQAGEFPVGVLRNGLAGQAQDATLYLRSDELAAGVAADVPLPRLQRLPDAAEYGEAESTDDGGLVLRLWESDGLLQARALLRDDVWRLVGVTWAPRAAP